MRNLHIGFEGAIMHKRARGPGRLIGAKALNNYQCNNIGWHFKKHNRDNATPNKDRQCSLYNLLQTQTIQTMYNVHFFWETSQVLPGSSSGVLHAVKSEAAMQA
jgi:hypothetical protein